METLIECEETMQKFDDSLEWAFQSKLNISNNDGDNKNIHYDNYQNKDSFTNCLRG